MCSDGVRESPMPLPISPARTTRVKVSAEDGKAPPDSSHVNSAASKMLSGEFKMYELVRIVNVCGMRLSRRGNRGQDLR
jgi:hypothetical protein